MGETGSDRTRQDKVRARVLGSSKRSRKGQVGHLFYNTPKCCPACNTTEDEREKGELQGLFGTVPKSGILCTQKTLTLG